MSAMPPIGMQIARVKLSLIVDQSICFQAGLCHHRDSANVQLCLNTEAAAIYYRCVSDVNGETLPHKEGLQYLTVHCGGINK